MSVCMYVPCMYQQMGVCVCVCTWLIGKSSRRRSYMHVSADECMYICTMHVSADGCMCVCVYLVDRQIQPQEEFYAFLKICCIGVAVLENLCTSTFVVCTHWVLHRIEIPAHTYRIHIRMHIQNNIRIHCTGYTSECSGSSTESRSLHTHQAQTYTQSHNMIKLVKKI